MATFYTPCHYMIFFLILSTSITCGFLHSMTQHMIEHEFNVFMQCLVEKYAHILSQSMLTLPAQGRKKPHCTFQMLVSFNPCGQSR